MPRSWPTLSVTQGKSSQLSERELNWEVTVNNISFIYDTGMKQELRFRFNFGDDRAISGPKARER